MQIDILGTIFRSILKTYWPWLILLAAFYIFTELAPDFFASWKRRNKFNSGEKWRSDRDLLQWLRGMKPSEFEDYVADLFSRLGYKTHAVGQSHDGGVDVVAEKDGITNYIQCKKFITSEVRVGDVRDFYGSLADHLANGQGYFITTNKFTLESRKFAEDKPIELIDGYELVRYIRMAKKNDKPILAPVTIQSNHICPRCGGSLVRRTGKFGAFNGCSNFPKCKYTQQA